MLVRRLTKGYGQAYDSHCNLVLGEVEETIYVVDDEDDDEEKVQVRIKRHVRDVKAKQKLGCEEELRNAVRQRYVQAMA